MTTSASQSYNATRDQILNRAAAICHMIGEGEVLNSTQLTQYSRSLNDVLYEWNTIGLPIWEYIEYTITPVAGTFIYDIGLGMTVNAPAPIKVTSAYRRITATTLDTPLLPISQFDWSQLAGKNGATTGAPTHYYFRPATAIGGYQHQGILTTPQARMFLYPTPDANTASTMTIKFVGQKQFDEFTTSTDTIDMPQFAINAMVWSVAEQLAYEGAGLPFAERSMISKMADRARDRLLSFLSEEGSLYIRPEANWEGSNL